MQCQAIAILRAIKCNIFAFRTLGSPHLSYNDLGELCYRVGNSSLLLRCSIGGRCHSLKCYLASSPYRRQIYGAKLREEELYIPLDHRGGVWLDVVVEEWIPSETLLQRVSELVECGDYKRLRELSQRFDAFALEMLASECAHGDVTFENIVVDSCGELHLVDFDAAFVPQLEGLPSLELGTEAFQHPKRTLESFDRHIDDYSLALISTSLAALAISFEGRSQCEKFSGVPFTAREILGAGSELYELTLDRFAREGEVASYAIARLLLSQEPSLPRLYSLLHLKVHGAEPASQELLPQLQGVLWGYYDERRREVIPPIFDLATPFSDSLAVVQIGSVWHYIDPQARVAINGYGCSALKRYSNGVARGVKDGKSIILERLPK